MKKIRLFPITLVVLVGLAIIGGVVSAQDSGQSTGTFTQRVAMILNVNETALQDAMKQARQELAQEKVVAAVESGKITQEQADRKLVWIQATLEERKAMRLEKIQSGLAAAVESDKITQEQADAKLEAFMAKPVGERYHGKHRHGKPGYQKFGKN
jgi:hypothetical protein